MKFKKILHAAVLLLIGHTAFSKADEKPTNFFSYLCQVAIKASKIVYLLIIS